MHAFYPFIHEKKKKKDFEPIPLHIETIPPQEPLPLEKEEDSEKEEKVIIIELQLFFGVSRL